MSPLSSQRSVAILDEFAAWDMTVPWIPIYWDTAILRRYHSVGYSHVSLTLQDWPPTFVGTLDTIERFKTQVAGETDWLVLVKTLGEVDQARAHGKLAVSLNSQESRLIDEDVSRLTTLWDLGVRHMILAYNVRNIVADGCAELANAGLSNFGRTVVAEMNRIGMIIDCSHTGERSSLEAMYLSDMPVIFSHSNAAAVASHIRNISDVQIKRCAATGGVIGVVGVGAFLGDMDARPESMFRQVDYIAELVGWEHVGLGTDYVDILPVADHPTAWNRPEVADSSWPPHSIAWPEVEGNRLKVEDSRCFPPEGLPVLIELMLNHGYSKLQIAGILGENFRRVFAAAEQRAAKKNSLERD